MQETGLVGVVTEVEEDRLRRTRPKLQDLVVHRDESLRGPSRIRVNDGTELGRAPQPRYSNNFILQQQGLSNLAYRIE